VRIAAAGTSFIPLPFQAWYGYMFTIAHRVEVEVGADEPSSAHLPGPPPLRRWWAPMYLCIYSSMGGGVGLSGMEDSRGGRSDATILHAASLLPVMRHGRSAGGSAGGAIRHGGWSHRSSRRDHPPFRLGLLLVPGGATRRRSRHIVSAMPW
jgi:hypothetical protein